MNAFLEWLDDRTNICTAYKNCETRPLPGGARWTRVWPCTIIFTFAVQVITGLVLWMYYSPSAQSAWESVYYIQHNVWGGWLLRAIHHYSGQALLVLVALYVIQLVLTWKCRAPREFVFWTAVFMGLCTLALLLTGDLLAWDQNSQSATLVRVNFLMLLPLVGVASVQARGRRTGFRHAHPDAVRRVSHRTIRRRVSRPLCGNGLFSTQGGRCGTCHRRDPARRCSRIKCCAAPSPAVL